MLDSPPTKGLQASTYRATSHIVFFLSSPPPPIMASPEGV
jgi:hypothetical protein